MKAKLVLILSLVLALSFFSFVSYAQDDLGTGETSGDLEQVEEKEGYVTFDFKNADIRNVLRIFSHKTGINIVAGKEVSGTVTITLRDVPWEKALKLVLNINGYGYVRDGNVIKVLTLEQLAQEPLETKVYTLNYAKPADVKATIE
ncbi:MAG: secretin and TonB N-terminal domain-containing protein, partial [Candidatus Aureabacteria bacterium]|nr:secretin and TonB N-terminal domain-containing protein [Candidatus Auribacterota bacterium]